MFFLLKRILLVQLFPILLWVRAVNSPWEPIHAADVAFLRVISLKSMENDPALQQIWEHTIPVLQGAPAARADAEIQQSARGCVCACHTAPWHSPCDDGGEMSVCSCWGSLAQGTSWRDPPGATTPAAQGGEESDAG